MGAAVLSTLIVAATLVCLGALAADWWPGVADVDDGLRLIGLIRAGYALAAAGILWLIPAACSLRWRSVRTHPPG